MYLHIYRLIDNPKDSSHVRNKSMVPVKTPTQLDLRVKHFFCVMPDTEQTMNDYQKRCTLGIAVKSMNDIEYIEKPMIMIENGIFYAYMQVSQLNLQTIGRVKYIYKRLNIKQSSWLEGDKVQKLIRPRNFIQLDYYFDYLQPGKMFSDKLEAQRQTYRMIKCLVSKFKEKNNVSTLIGFIEFSRIEQSKYPIIDWLFENLMAQYRKLEKIVPIILDDIQVYVIEVISAFEIQQLMAHRDIVWQLLSQFMLNELGYFRNLFPVNIPQRVQRGLYNLVIFCPKLGLEFLDFSVVVPNQNQFLSLLLKEEQNHAYVLSSLPKLLNEFNFDDSIIIAVGINLINNANTLKNVFNYYITLCLYVKEEHDEQLTKAFAGKALQFSNLQIRALIDQQIELMVGNQHINKMYGEVVKTSVIENLRNDSQQSRQTFKELVQNGIKFFEYDYLERLISSESKLCIQFQKQIPKLINAWFNLLQSNQFSKYKQICSQNLFILLNHHNSNLASLLSCLEILDQQSSLLIISPPELWGDWDENQVYDTLSQRLVDHLLSQNFNQQTILEELQLYISQNPDISAQMHRCAIKIVIKLLSEVGLTVNFIPVVLKQCFTLEKLIKHDYLKPVVEKVLELCKFSQNPTIVQLLDKSVYLASLKIGEEVSSEKSPYLSYLRTEMRKVIDSICDRSIQMKTVQEIRKSKPRRIIEVARYFRPSFEIELLDSLNFLQESYQLNMEKFAQFLSQTVKTEFFDASLLLQNNLKEIQSGFNSIEARQLETRSLWSNFNDFKTIDMFYLFRNSKLFDNIILQELTNQNIKSKIIYLSDDYFNSVANFDEFCLTEIFNKAAFQHFENLLKYPESELSFEKMGRYWRGIAKDRIATEICIVEEFIAQYHNSNLKASQQLINDLDEFSQLPIRIKNASNIIKIEGYVTNNRTSILDEDDDYKSLQKLIGFGNSFSSTLELRELISELQDLKSNLQELETNKSIDFSVIKILGEMKDLFKLYMVSNGYNIYDFLDQMSGQKPQEFDQIIVHIFLVFSQIEKSQRLFEQYNIGNGSLINQSFMSFLELVSADFKRHSSVQLFESYLSQIRSMIPHMDRTLSSLVDLETFNLKSVLVYESLIQCENIRFLRVQEDSQITGEESKFIYHFQLTSNQTGNNAYQEEEYKGGAEAQLNQAQVKVMDSNHMLRLQVKVKLLMKSQKVCAIEGMDDQRRSNIESVHQIFKHTEDIKRTLKKGSKWCKRLPNKVLRSEGHANILEDLVLFHHKLKLFVDQIKSRHLDYIQKFTFFNWIEEHEGKSLVDAIQKNDKSGVEQVLSQLSEKQIMQHLIDLQNVEDLHNSDLLNTIQNNFQQMIEAQEYYVIKEITNAQSEFIVKQVKVEDNESIRLQILRISIKHGRAPSFHDVFFCREHTTYDQLQLFIFKAITYPPLCGQKVKRAFIIANFEILKPIVAQKSQDLITASSASGVQFNLYVLNIVEKMSKEQSKNLSGIEYMGAYISKYTRIFTSEKPGLGKSSKITQQCKSMNLFCKEIHICNERKTLSIIKDHKQHLKEFLMKSQRQNTVVQEFQGQKSEENSLKLAFSYNISQPYSTETLSRRLFDILILRVIRDETSQQMFHFPKRAQIFIEVSMEMLSWFHDSVFSKVGFKTVHITQSQALLDFNITYNKDWIDLGLGLDALEDNKKGNRRLQTTTKLKDFAILDINKDNLKKRIFTSGYYTAKAFVRFGSKQNELLKYSALSNEQLMNEFLRMSLNLSKNQQIMPGNSDDFRLRCLALILKSCEQIILDVDTLKQEAFNQRRKFDLMNEIQNQNLIFLTYSLRDNDCFRNYISIIQSYIRWPQSDIPL